MCLLFFSYRTTPGYRLVVAANRDEFFARPTAPLDFLDKEKTILAGRDLQGGGTWLGITAQLKFAAITNYREAATARPDAPSRGEILTNYLSDDVDAGEYLCLLAEDAGRYNGFNLILGDKDNLYYYSNRSTGQQQLEPGFYGLSNNLLDVPWPKVVRGKKLLRPYMTLNKRIDPLLIFNQLEDNNRPSDDTLPETGVGLEWEQLLSTIHIEGDIYGTRSSAVITVTNDGTIDFVEKTLKRSSSKDLISHFTHRCMNVLHGNECR